MDRFPLDTTARYDYASRFSTAKGGHHGCDIFSAEGTPVVAVEEGDARRAIDPKGGLVVYLLNLRTGNHYYYAHLRDVDAHLPVAPKSTHVSAGQLLGHVGTTGNARGTSPHLHFQLRQRGKIVDPYPYLVAVDPLTHREGGPPPKPSPVEPGSRPGYGTRTTPPIKIGPPRHLDRGEVTLSDIFKKAVEPAAQRAQAAMFLIGAMLLWNWFGGHRG